MLSEIQIVSGAEGTPWTRDQRECVLEIRSEHTLDDPTSFSILMHDKPRDPDHRLLAVGRKVAVLARPGTSGDWTVLFQGKVVEIETNETQGGAGSTILYRGVDIRTVMAGRSFTGSWSGHVDAVMEHIINLDFPSAVVHAPDVNTLEEGRNPLAQNSNNLDFLRQQAVALGHNLWVTYETVPDTSNDLALPNPLGESPSITIEPTIHWGRSPYLEMKLGNLSLPEPSLLGPVPLLNTEPGPVTFKVHMNSNQCPNVTQFEVMENGQEVATMPQEQSSGAVPLDVPAPPVGGLGSAPDADDPVVYFQPPAARQCTEDEHVNEALEITRSFNRKVKVSSTKRKLERLFVSHDLAQLEGVDAPLADIMYRVREATHVIRIDDHYMDAVLDSEGTVPAASAASPLSALGVG